MKTTRTAPTFKRVALVDVPHARNGKHKKIVTAIICDLDRLEEGAAFKVPLAELGDTKENVRSALNRATRKAGRAVATATDGDFLYVWNVTRPKSGNAARRTGPDKLPRNSRHA